MTFCRECLHFAPKRVAGPLEESGRRDREPEVLREEGNYLSAHLQILNGGVEEQPDDAVHLKADVPAQYFIGI